MRGRIVAFGSGILVAAAFIVFAIYYYGMPTPDSAHPGHTKFLIASLVEIEPIAELREGFKQEILNSRFGDQVDFVERNAAGQPNLINQIAGDVTLLKPQAVYVLGTPLAQAIQKRNPSTLLLQGAVTDPVGAGLADSWQGSGRPYAATSDRPPVNAILIAIEKLVPNKSRLGVLYNPGESNSVAVVSQLRMAAAAYGFSVQEYGVASTQDLPAAISAAITGSDVLFIPPDNTVTSGLKGIVQSALAHKVPVFATTSDAVDLGALAAVATDFRELGRETADLAIDIIFRGINPATIPIGLPQHQQVVINSNTAQILGVSLDSARSAGYLIK